MFFNWAQTEPDFGEWLILSKKSFFYDLLIYFIKLKIFPLENVNVNNLVYTGLEI